MKFLHLQLFGQIKSKFAYCVAAVPRRQNLRASGWCYLLQGPDPEFCWLDGF